MATFVYTLRLSGECWYVGMTGDLERRVSQHFLLRGSEWTKIHRPLEVVAVSRGGEDLENAQTIALMYSWKRVRGGKYTSPVLCSQPKAIGVAMSRAVPSKLPKPAFVDDVHLVGGHCLRITQNLDGEGLGILCGRNARRESFRALLRRG